MSASLTESLDVHSLLAHIPQPLREELLKSYNSIVINYRERRWEPSELNGGKLCEVVFTILRGYIDGVFPNKSSKPGNMVDACRAFEQTPSTFPRSVRILIPRMLIALYEVRNNRGVGHVGGDVNPNKMDATCVFYMSKWIIAELVRVFHNVDTAVAEAAIDAIVERTLPIVWKVGKKLRVLDTKVTMKEKTLILLYQSPTHLGEQELFDWVEHSNLSIYRGQVLSALHDDKFIEYDKEQRLVYLSPIGVAFVEKDILPKLRTVA